MSLEEYAKLDTPSGWDAIQIEYVNKLIDKTGIVHLFETGTYLGVSSRYFHEKRLKVHTSEINPSYFESARNKLKGLDIEMCNIDSKEHLRWFLNRGLDNVLYYLDAHWDFACPLKEELNLILALPKFLILVHDVPVPNKPEYIYEGSIIDIWNEYLKNDTFPIGTTMIYPKYDDKNIHPPYKLVGYCIISKGYPLIMDDRFMFMEKTVKQ
jgi:hypothetical protein